MTMKVKAKPHVLDSNEPLKEGTDYTALCGARVPSVRFVYWWDELEAGYAYLSVFGTCSDCRTAQLSNTEAKESKRYIFGIVSGQEAKTEAVSD